MADAELAETRLEFIVVVSLSALILFFLLAAQFQSLLLPLLLFSTVLFAIPGALVGLRLFGQPLSLGAGLGGLMLLGLVINTGIVLFATYRRRRHTAAPARRWATVLAGSQQRIRAVASTALSTVVALLPVALIGSAHSGLAAVVVGGILASTLFTLAALPIAYGALVVRNR